MSALNVTVLCGSLQRPSRTLVLCEALLAKLGEHCSIVPQVLKISQFDGRWARACSAASCRPRSWGIWTPSSRRMC